MKFSQEVRIPAGAVEVVGSLEVPENAIGLVIFAHGSGSSRHSPRNRFVAGELQRSGIGTLLIDLLTEMEESDRRNVFDIQLLAERLVAAARWVRLNAKTAALPIGYFGASTGAGAALVAAADSPDLVCAVVSRGGRPDLASDSLPGVQAPTLLIVGGYDTEVIELNRQAQDLMVAKCELVIIPGATHLFEESGTLEQVAEVACQWFIEHFKRNG